MNYISPFSETMLKSIPLAVVIVDEDMQVLYVNEAMEEMVGTNVAGKKCYEICKDNKEQCNKCPLKKTLRIGEKKSLEVEGVLGERIFRITHCAGEWQEKKVVLEVFEDITEKRQAEKDLQKSLERLQHSMIKTIETVASIVEMKDPYTAGHQKRVARIACMIAYEMGLTEEQLETVRMAGMIHDLGKITIPSEILSKPGKICEIEFSLIKTHSQIGYDILKKIDFPWPISKIILQHHERIDGSGYPLGLKGEDILLESQIIAVADVVEAIMSHRPYRPAKGIETALNEIQQKKGIFYDVQVVESCLKLSAVIEKEIL